MKRIFCTVAAALVLSASSAAAAVVGGMVTAGSGSFFELDPTLPGFGVGQPNLNVGNNTFQNNNLYAFNEDQNIILPSDITVDGGTLTAGTVVASHYVFFDPRNFTGQQGYVDFDANIIGIATSTAQLSATDFLINNLVTYLNPGLRGLEGGDSAVVDGTIASRLLVNWQASTPGDYVRIFTAQSPSGPDPRDPDPVDPVPLPAGVFLLLSALGILGLKRFRKA
jgi:hypothetical protein